MDKQLPEVKVEPKQDARSAALVPRNGAATNGVVKAADVSRLSTPELVARIAQDAQDLVKAEIQLAKSELRTTAQGVGAMVKRMAVAGVLALGAYFALLGAAVAGLSLVLETWAAFLVVAGVTLVVAGTFALMGAKAVPKAPLERTRRSVQEDLKLAKDNS